MNTFLPGLYIVSTPIGNLDDITLRSIIVLKKSDIILCEDTRHSLKLLNHLGIKKKLISYHKFNERKELDKIIKYLKEGKIMSIISDAGTPILSDPGNTLVKECIKEKINIVPIPGASSVTASISIAGFEDQFLFYGFLSKKEKDLEKTLLSLSNINYSLVFFIPSVKINFYLKQFKKFFIGRNIFIAEEISKIHETFYRSSVDNIKLFNSPVKGELTIVISKELNTKNKQDNVINLNIEKEAAIYLKKYSLKDVVDLISKKNDISKKKVYEICLKIKNKNEKIN